YIYTHPSPTDIYTLSLHDAPPISLYGHRWRIANRFAIPTLNNNIGFYKLEFEASWFTPLIAEYDLILKLHGYFGIAAPFKNRTRSEEHTSELQSRSDLVCRLLLEK